LFGKQKIKNKAILVETILDSNKVSLKEIKKRTNLSRLETRQLLEMFNTAQLRDLADTYNVKLVIKRAFRGKIPVTKRDDIIELLKSKLTKQKILRYSKGEKPTPIKKIDRQRTISKGYPKKRRAPMTESVGEYFKIIKETLNELDFMVTPKTTETNIEKQIVTALQIKLGKSQVLYEKNLGRARLDILIRTKDNKQIGLELKLHRGGTSLQDRLAGQVRRYSQIYDEIIAIVLTTKSKSMVEADIRPILPKNVGLIVKKV
jgi:predicted metalloendopeptidase